jgi:hypothetical protein
MQRARDRFTTIKIEHNYYATQCCLQNKVHPSNAPAAVPSSMQNEESNKGPAARNSRLTYTLFFSTSTCVNPNAQKVHCPTHHSLSSAATRARRPTHTSQQEIIDSGSNFITVRFFGRLFEDLRQTPLLSELVVGRHSCSDPLTAGLPHG